MIGNTSYKLTRGAEVRGWVKFFNADKRFGFVTVDTPDGNVDVYMGGSKARRVSGTCEEPVLSDEAFDYAQYRFRPYGTEVILRVEPDHKGGWRAKCWGVVPEFTWFDLQRKYPELLQERYVGGQVELQNRSDHGSGGYTARIDSLELTDEHLTVRARHYPNSWRAGNPWPAEEALGRSFEAVYPVASMQQKDQFGRLVLSWREPEGNAFNELYFQEPRP